MNRTSNGAGEARAWLNSIGARLLWREIQEADMGDLSPHFSLAEFEATQHRDIDNRAPAELHARLANTAEQMERVRAILGGRVITISSGYRSPLLNKAVGGAPTSAHVQGYACDFNCFSFGRPIDVCRAIAASDLQFDQLIEEGTWVHISFDPRLRRQVMTKRAGGGYETGLRAA